MKALFFILFPILVFSQENKIQDIFESTRQGDLNKVMEYVAINPKIVNSLNKNKQTLLIIASYYDRESIVSYLLPLCNNIDYQSDNGTALAAAVVKNNVTIINDLLKYNANVNIADADGVTPLMYAILFRNSSVIKLLIQHKANMALIDNSGKTTFEYALATENQDIINLIKN